MTVRVGVVGVGVMGADHARKLAKVVSGSELVAVTDFDPTVAGAVAAELDARVHDDGYALIADSGVDAVVIGTRDDTHADLVRAALRAGKPVMCEKPLAPTAAECREVVAAEAALKPPSTSSPSASCAGSIRRMWRCAIVWWAANTGLR